jgi:hydrogenase maturation factor
MNLIYGEVVDIFTENEIKFGKVRVGRALKKVPIELLTNVARGDTILLCDGVAISRVEGNDEIRTAKPETMTNDKPQTVPGCRRLFGLGHLSFVI